MLFEGELLFIERQGMEFCKFGSFLFVVGGLARSFLFRLGRFIISLGTLAMAWMLVRN